MDILMSLDILNYHDQTVLRIGTKNLFPLADEALDVAIFSLSLMGKNWHDYIKEAKRCLVTNGILIIAETTKSLRGRLSKLRNIIQTEGFEIYSDEERV